MGFLYNVSSWMTDISKNHWAQIEKRNALHPLPNHSQTMRRGASLYPLVRSMQKTMKNYERKRNHRLQRVFLAFIRIAVIKDDEPILKRNPYDNENQTLFEFKKNRVIVLIFLRKIRYTRAIYTQKVSLKNYFEDQLMAKKNGKGLLVGLDIGTTKIIVLVGEVTSEKKINIIGMGAHPSNGLKRGVVVNIEATMQSIRRAVEEAELMAGCDIHEAYTGIAGSHIRSFNSHGIVAIRGQEVTQSDIDRVIEAAKAVAIPADQKILHVLPQAFAIDDQYGIQEPISMSGVRLESKVHIITGAVSAAQNITKCVKRCGLDVNDIILEQLASSYAVLTPDERELGVCLVDIGGGTTDIAVFIDGAIQHTAVIPIAGNQATNDIAIMLRTPTQHAESIKLKHGCALQRLAEENAHIEVPSVSNQSPYRMSPVDLAKIIEARYEELFLQISSELERHRMKKLITSGVVLTGGASHMKGSLALAESIFNMPVRLGLPSHVEGLTDALKSPTYATSVGLLLYGYQQRQAFTPSSMDRSKKSIWERMKSWFDSSF